MKPLTSRQSTVLEFVAKYSDRRGFPPTLREIGDGTGLSNISAVCGHIAAIEKKGYITKDPDKARSIRIVHSPSTLSKFKRHLHKFARTDKGVLHKIVYGVALATRKHREYFVGERKRWIDEALKRRAVEHGWTFLRKQIEPDHIVLVVEAWPNHSPELVVSRIRQSGNKIRLRHVKHFPGKSLWAKGYVATTNLESLDEMVLQLLHDTLSTEKSK
ncbi:MAG: transposase [Anaerolineaceae bacterium]|nr:transposase [Anaerolineaceae bacterium]